MQQTDIMLDHGWGHDISVDAIQVLTKIQSALLKRTRPVSLGSSLFHVSMALSKSGIFQ